MQLEYIDWFETSDSATLLLHCKKANWYMCIYRLRR